MTTQQVLNSLLKENTGTHMCDSGGAYGRNWQRNQTRDFDHEPAVSLEFSIWKEGSLEIEYTRNVYHFLNEVLEYNPELDADFQAFLESHDYYEFEAMKEYCDLHDYDSNTVNTYNGECNLSQTLQWTTFGSGDLYGQNHVLLQIHGGCDVRGGYSTPKVFDLKDECGLYLVADGEISCSKCGMYWSTDDSYHWYAEGSCGLGAGTQLEEYDAVKGNRGKKGKVVVTENGEAFCPCCGQGKLQA